MNKSRKHKKIEKRNTKIQNLKKTWYGQIFYFIWYEDSILSWIANIILAFILIKFIFYPVLSLAFGTSLPVVAVVSCSMEHRFTDCGFDNKAVNLCGIIDNKGSVNFNEYWLTCGDFYEKRNISKEKFDSFIMSNGFNKGDIIFLRGVKPENIEVGDILVFDADNKAYPIIHRVIETKQENNNYIFQTKGDNNPSQINDGILNEHAVPESKIRGIALFKVPWVGYVKIYFVKLVSLFI